MRNTGFDPVAAEFLNKRLQVVTILVVFVLAALVLRLWFLQIISGPEYRVQSENNRIHLQDIPPFRGMIFDRNGELLVDNYPSFNMYVIPEEIQNRDELLNSLEKLVGLSHEWVGAKLKNRTGKQPFKPLLIKKNITRDELARVETNLFNLPGVMIQVRPQRYYIFKNFAAHLIGYLGEISESQLNKGKYQGSKAGDLIGKYGVEEKWQQFLNGRRGGEQVEVDAAGRKLRVISRKPPTPGLNITLTIDKDIQMLAEKQLKGKKGAVVAMNPKNGAILALASSPSFDPNLFIGGIKPKEWRRLSTSKDYPLQNRAISGQYPPGSIFKIVVALAGLEEGIIDPEEEIFCNGSYTMGNRVYRCWRKQGHGMIAFHRAVVESCDVYFYKTGRRLGIDKIARYSKMLGLGEVTSFQIGNEKSGLIPTRQWKLKRWGIPWQKGETISIAIGQSYLLVTPLQMVRVISAVFNGGKLYQPKVIKWIGKENRKVKRLEPFLMGRIKADHENMELLKNALIGVVNEPRGTGRRSRVKGATVAGKTGTAQVINLEAEKKLVEAGELPAEFKDHAWFVAVAPAEDPVFAVAVLAEHGGHGGSASAPIAGELIKAYLNKP